MLNDHLARSAVLIANRIRMMLALLRLLVHYAAMNAQIFPWDDVMKDKAEGMFKRRSA